MDKIIAECDSGTIAKIITVSFGYFFIKLVQKKEVIKAYIEVDSEVTT